MRTLLLGVVLIISVASYAQNEPFTKRVVATGFNSAWEVVYGPGDSLWVTENRGYTIQRVNIANGNKTQLIDIKATDGTMSLPSTGQQAQGGLMGMAVHPNLYSTNAAVRALKPWVYVVYVYRRNTCPGTQTSCSFSTKIVRYTYSGNTLTSPFTILDNIPGSNDHNSGRLILGPTTESGQYRLYYTLGDMGSGRDKNLTRTQNSLNLNSLEGKVLRLNSEDDGDGGTDAWVPNDNPFYNNSSITPRDYVYSFGHRNPQGLAWGYNGSGYSLYSSEQMDKTDDEVNLIQPGRSYGWDSVAGYCDDNVNGTRIGQTLSTNEGNYCTTHADHTEPIYTLYTATAAEVATMPASNSLWPTAALSSIDHYALGIIPGWNYSVLVSPLKENLVYRLKLNANGTAVTGDTISYFRGDGNRVRRIRVAPDGLRFYVARDVGASANGGAIMEYTYSGVLLNPDTLASIQRPNLWKQISLHPNPARTMVTIDYPRSFAKPAVVELYTIDGVRIMGERSFNSQVSLHIAHLHTGIYLLKITNGLGQLLHVKKLIKQ